MERFFCRRIGSIMALLAFAVVSVSGAMSRLLIGQVVARGLVAMLVFYIVGYLAGWVGFRVVAERSVDSTTEDSATPPEPQAGNTIENVESPPRAESTEVREGG